MKMNEDVLFKSSFWLGRLIWVSGPFLKREEKLAQMLGDCGVSLSRITRLTAQQFIDVSTRDFPSEWREGREVLVVSGFERINRADAEAFSRAVKLLSSFREAHSLRLILVSDGSISPHLRGFVDLKPVQIFFEETSDESNEVNERLHHLISLAMKVTGITIRKLSERAAVFLEEFLEDEGEEDTFLLLLRGLMRATGWELRLRDLIAHFDFEQAQFTPQYDT